MARTKKIVLCKMFTGDYWEDENNLGYETINMFIPDDQALAIDPISYMYLPANGDYKLEDHKITHVLLVRSVPDTDGTVVQIIGKAEVVDELLWDEKEKEPKNSKCVGGKEFVGLYTLFKIFNPKDKDKEEAEEVKEKIEISEDEVKENIENIAEQYGMKAIEIQSSNYFFLAVALGLIDDISKKIPEEDFIKLYKEKNNGEIPNDWKTQIKEEVNDSEYKQKIQSERAPTEYNYWYAHKQGWLEDKKDDTMSWDDFCEVVLSRYNDNIRKMREIFTSPEQKEVRNTVYGGLTYDQIFKRNKHYGSLNICASLQVKNLHLVDENSKLYLKRDENGQLYLSQNKDKKIDSDNDIDLEQKIDQKKLSATSQTVFIPFVGRIWDKICKRKEWVRSQPLTIENTPYLEDSYLTVAKHEYDELTYSNLFAYFFKKSPKFVEYFFKNVQFKTNENNEYKSLIEGISTTKGVSAETVEISDEDWKKLKPENEKATVKREEKNIDIVLRTEDKVIVIENKIKSALNGKEITKEAVNSQSQEDSSSNGKNTNNKLTFKDQLMRYYQYIEEKYPTGNDGSNKHYFIFAPDYNPIENEHFGKVGEKNMEEVWKVVPYSAIFEGIKDYHIDEDDNLKNDFDKNLFKEFLKALYVHTDSSANNYYRQMQKRLMRIKAQIEAEKKKQ